MSFILKTLHEQIINLIPELNENTASKSTKHDYKRELAHAHPFHTFIQIESRINILVAT